jgi:hypothetical protein
MDRLFVSGIPSEMLDCIILFLRWTLLRINYPLPCEEWGVGLDLYLLGIHIISSPRIEVSHNTTLYVAAL